MKQQGAILVDIKKFDDKSIGKNENLVLNTELKADLAKYLRSSPAPIAARTLGDLIAFDKEHAQQEMTLFGQEQFEQAEKTKGLHDPDYKKARQASFQAAGPNGIDRLLNNIRSSRWLVRPPAPHGRSTRSTATRFSGGGAGSLAAVAGYRI